MFRKLMIAAVAATTMAIGVGAQSTGAEAKVRIYIGTPGYYYGPGYYHGYRYYPRHRNWHCHIVKVKRHGVWKKVRRCHSVRHW